MSPEGREYLSQVAQREMAQAVANRTDKRQVTVKSKENYPNKWGTATNKRISVTGVWRK